MPEGAAVPFTRDLLTAERLAKGAGKVTNRGSGEDPQGKRVPLLLVTHGSISVFVREAPKGVVVLAQVHIPEESRKGLAGVSEPDRKQALMVLKTTLLQNPRTGWNVVPPDAQAIDSVTSLVLEQYLRISEDDIGSINRFSDAVQEIASAVVQASLVFGIALGGSRQTYSPDSQPPPDIYR